MPYPSQIDLPTIIEAASAIIEREGEEALSLGGLAKQLGVKAPSLYRYVDGKDALYRAVNTRTVERLITALEAVANTAPDAPIERLVAICEGYREFALAHPALYMLALTNTVDAQRPDEAYMESLALPLQEAMAALSGEAPSLAALRGAMALVHGFVTLELAGQYRRGGDLQAAFRASVRAYLRGWQG